MERYSRQILLEEIGSSGQQRLAKAKVAIVGCGGLGCLAASYLAGAGVGQLILIDGDIPELSNLHRQIMFSTGEKQSKAKALVDRLKKLNPELGYQAIDVHLSKANIDELLTGVDLVLECTDDIQVKYLVNDFCQLEAIPLVYAAIYKFEGYISLFKNRSEADIHLRDIFPEPTADIPKCSEVGVFNTIAGIIALLQANEALKYILNLGDSLNGQLLTYNCLNNEQTKLRLNKNWQGDLETIFEEDSYKTESCPSHLELNPKDLLASLEKVKLISIMKPTEHEDLSDQVQQVSVHDLSWIEQFNDNDTAVIYCRSGYESGQLVLKLSRDYPDLKILSLKGGYLAYQKLKALH